jgi:Recombination endonuclease VII
VTLRCDIGPEKEAPLTEEPWMTEPVEVEELTGPRRKRRKFRKYARPVCSDDQWQAILALQHNRCPVCDEEVPLFQDRSYRSGKMRGGLCRQCNCASGMLKDSPTRIKRLLAYLANPPPKALGFRESEKERV